MPTVLPMMRWIERASTLHILFFTGVAGFTSGIFVRSFIDIGYAGVGLVVLIGCALLAVGMRVDVSSKHPRARKMFAFFLIAFAIGSMRFEMTDARLLSARATLSQYENREIEIVGEVVREPDLRAARTLLTLETKENVRVLVYAPPRSRVSYGDVIQTEGILKRPESFSSGADRVFDYEGYLSKDRVVYTLTAGDVLVTENGKGNMIIATLLSVKHVFLSGATRAFPEPDAGLLAGIVWGEKHGVSESLSQDFRNSGLIHIIVLSGYNMTIVAVFIMWMFGRFPMRTRFSFAIAAIILFAIAAGGGATVFRAAIMAVIAFLAKASGRPNAVAVSLTLAAFLMLLWNPRVLMYDPSFQLSFLATLGLIYISPLIERRILFMPRAWGIREITAATIGTQIAVLPLILYMMGTLSLVSVPANILALPLIPAIMFIGMAGAIMGLIGYVVALPFVFVAHVLIAIVIGIAHFFGSLPLAAISVPLFSPLILFAVYVALLLIIAHYTTRPFEIREYTTI